MDYTRQESITTEKKALFLFSVSEANLFLARTITASYIQTNMRTRNAHTRYVLSPELVVLCMVKRKGDQQTLTRDTNIFIGPWVIGRANRSRSRSLLPAPSPSSFYILHLHTEQKPRALSACRHMGVAKEIGTYRCQ